VTTAQNLQQIYDFGGFEEEMYQQIYHPPGSPAIAEKILNLLNDKGIPCAGNSNYGLDHGAWCPLKLMYPAADIPVVQVSLIRGLDPQKHLRLGEALTSLLQTEPNVLFVGSGGVTHNLGDISRSFGRADTASDWASGFATWVEEILTTKESQEREASLVAFETHKFAKKAHPRTEHFLPLVVLTGIKGTGKAIKLHDRFSWNFSMAAYAFPVPEKD